MAELNQDQRLGLAMGAMYAEVNGLDHTTLIGCEPGMLNKSAAKKMLADSWDVKDHDDLAGALEWLYEEGHRAEYADEGNDPAEILAWDMCRIINLVRFGARVGYLNEQEGWDWISKSRQSMLGTFTSWDEMASSFLAGRSYWLEANEIEDDDFDEINETIEELLDHDNTDSVWNSVEWPGAGKRLSNADMVNLFTEHREALEKAMDMSKNDIDKLNDAICNSDTAAVKEFLKGSPDLNNLPEGSYNPLCMAVYYGNAEIAGLLLKSGASPDGRNEYNQPAICGAVENGYEEIVKLLIAAGADLSVKDDEGQAPLDIAKYNEADDMIKILKKAGAK